jgi:hypothetical protein
MLDLARFPLPPCEKRKMMRKKRNLENHEMTNDLELVTT